MYNDPDDSDDENVTDMELDINDPESLSEQCIDILNNKGFANHMILLAGLASVLPALHSGIQGTLSAPALDYHCHNLPGLYLWFPLLSRGIHMSTQERDEIVPQLAVFSSFFE